MYGCVWLGRSTIHKLKAEYQLFKRISAGLTGFSGEKIAYRTRLFQAVSASAGRAGNSPDLICLRKFYAEILRIQK